jgi:hypothetical protein
MTRLMLFGAVAITAVPVAIAGGCFETAPATDASAPQLRKEVEERFAIRHCYGLYRYQEDIVRCLARAM